MKRPATHNKADLRQLADEIRAVLPVGWSATSTSRVLLVSPGGNFGTCFMLAPYEADAFLRAYDPQGTRTAAYLLDLFAQRHRGRG